MQSKKISNSKRDKLINQCENLLVRGTDSVSEISKVLGVSYNTARGYMKIVKVRWSESKTMEEIQADRTNLIRKTQEVIKECWDIKNNAGNALEATQALRTVLQAVEQLRRLYGLDNVPQNTTVTSDIQIFNMAQTVNQLPQEEYNNIMHAEINKRDNSEIDVRQTVI